MATPGPISLFGLSRWPAAPIGGMAGFEETYIAMSALPPISPDLRMSRPAIRVRLRALSLARRVSRQEGR